MFRWLVVGMGMAGRVHTAAIDLSPNAKLVAAVSKSKQDLDVPVFATLDEAITECDFDGVVVATPNHAHREYSTKAINAGRAVLCEKPVGIDLADARAIQSVAEAVGVPFGIVLNQRACRYARFVKALVDQERLVPSRCQFTAEMPRLQGWVAAAGNGGGLLRAVGVHYVDLLCWWFGSPERFEIDLQGEPVDDRLTLELEFPSGVLGSLQLTATSTQRQGPVRCAIEGAGQSIEIQGSEITHASGVPEPPASEEPDPRLWFGPGHATLIDEASTALAAGNDFPIPLAAGMEALGLIDTMARG